MSGKELKVIWSADANAVVREMKKVEGASKSVQDQIKASGDKFKQIGANFQQAGRSLTLGLTLPIVAAGGAAFKFASDWESAFAGVRKTVDATEGQFAQLAQGIRDMAKEIPVAATELARIAEVGGQLGVPREQLLAFTRTMADLGQTTNLTADQAATAFAQIGTIMGIAEGDFARMGAAVVDLGNKGATTESAITEMALRIAGAGKVIGLSKPEVLGFAAALANVGVEAEAGGSAISRVMITIANAVKNGGDELTAFAKVAGQSASSFAKQFSEAPAQAIVSFIQGLQRIDKAGGNVFATLDGLELGEVRVRDALLRLMGSAEAFPATLATANQAWQQNTALTDEAAKRYETTRAKITVALNKIKDSFITLGAALLPLVADLLEAGKPIIDFVARMASAFANAPKPLKLFIVGILALVAIIGPLLVVIGSFVGALGAIAVAFGVTVGAVLLFVGVVVAVIAIVGVLVYVIVRNWDTIKRWTVTAFTAVKNFLVTVWTAIANFFTQTIPRIIGNIISWFAGLPARIGAALLSLLTTVTTFLAALPERMAFYAGQAIGGFIRFWLELPGKIWAVLQAVWAFLVAFVPKAISWAIDLGSRMVNGVISWIQQLPGRVGNFLSQTWSRLVSWASQMVSKARETGSNIVSGIVNTIQSLPGTVSGIIGRVIDAFKAMVRRAFEAAKALASSLWNGFKSGLGISSPSFIERAMDQIGTNIASNTDASRTNLDMLRRSFRRVNFAMPLAPRSPSGGPNGDGATSSSAGSPVTNNYNLNVATNQSVGSVVTDFRIMEAIAQ